MALTMVPDDLLTDISKDERDGLAAQALESGQADPIETGITRALAIIEMYISPYLIKADALRRIWTLLAINSLYNRLSALPAKRKEERDWCYRVLEGVRDGKFPNMTIDPDVPADEIPTGTFGSRKAQNFGNLNSSRSCR